MGVDLIYGYVIQLYHIIYTNMGIKGSLSFETNEITIQGYKLADKGVISSVCTKNLQNGLELGDVGAGVSASCDAGCRDGGNQCDLLILMSAQKGNKK